MNVKRISKGEAFKRARSMAQDKGLAFVIYNRMECQYEAWTELPTARELDVEDYKVIEKVEKSAIRKESRC